MLKYFSVMLGGGIGASLRYFISLLTANFMPFFYCTFIINIAGCLFFGFITYLAINKPDFNPNFKLFLTTGIAGGFTTFSTFGYESFSLLQKGHIETCLIYISLSLIAGIISALTGMLAGKSVAEFQYKLSTKDITA